MPVAKVQIADQSVDESNIDNLRAPGGAGVPLREVSLGRVAPDPAKVARVPKFDQFVTEAVAPPVSKTWVNDAAMASIKQMYGNDQWGDCVIASVGHGVGVSSANESGTAIVGTTSEIVGEYHRICGPGDNGCVITDVKDEMVRAGISVGGKKRRLDGYAAIDPANKLAVQTAILIAGGGMNIGFNVPSRWMGSGTYDGVVWDIAPNQSVNSVGGHDIRAVGYTEQGVVFATWGIRVVMTWRALADSRVVDEAYVELEQDWNTDGAAPSGLDTAGLKAALDAFKAGHIPDWQPTVPPVPPPPVPPPPGPPVPTGGFTGIETNTFANGSLVSKVVATGKLPAPRLGEAYTIDLSGFGPIIRWRMKNKILAVLDHDSIIVTDNGDSLVISPKVTANTGAPDWQAFFDFLIKVLPIILQLIAAFG